MAITASHRDPNREKHFASGAFIDTGTVKKSAFKLGFTPRRVVLINATDRIRYEWWTGMAADSAIKTVDAGTCTLETSNGITVGDLATTTASAWTVYEATASTVGVPGTAAADETDCSRLNSANEVITGFNVPAAIVTTNKQFYWTAEA